MLRYVALSVPVGPLTSIDGSVSTLSGEFILCLCFAGLLVEGLDVPDDDPLCNVVIVACC